MDAKKTTAEDVKQVLAEYLRDNYPAGAWATAMFDTGVYERPETLVALSACPLPPSEPLCVPPSRG